MKNLVILFVALSSFKALASEVSCNQEITREPYCANLATAEKFCKTIGANPDNLLSAKKCFIKMSKIADAKSALSACLGMSLTSSDPKQNSSNCGQATQNPKTPSPAVK